MWSRFSRPSCAHAGSPGGSAGYKSACNVGDLGLIPVLGRSLREEKGYLLQYSGLEKPPRTRGQGRWPGEATRGTVAVQAQEGLEELSHVEGQEQRR